MRAPTMKSLGRRRARVRSTIIPSYSSTGRFPLPDRWRSEYECSRAGSVAPTCTSPRATSRRVVPWSRPATKSSGSSTASVRTRTASPRAIASASRGSPTPAECAGSARAHARTSASRRGSRDGTSTAVTPSTSIVEEQYAYPLSPVFGDVETAPLLCAGIIGYRALRQSECPPDGRLGIYGFGASAHLTAQVAIAEGLRVHVLTRSPEARQLALELGASSAGGASDPPPEPLDAALLFAPVGALVLPALEALDRGGTLAIAGIHLTDIPRLDYDVTSSKSERCAA